MRSKAQRGLIVALLVDGEEVGEGTRITAKAPGGSRLEYDIRADPVVASGHATVTLTYCDLCISPPKIVRS